MRLPDESRNDGEVQWADQIQRVIDGIIIDYSSITNWLAEWSIRWEVEWSFLNWSRHLKCIAVKAAALRTDGLRS